ncbi:MAG: 16S rRNA (guanine(966)-N(2))-methyltransferase RsmD [Janthinobacterium lividum]
MRVIAGTFRSRPLQAPRGTSTRPTSDRLRETLFNVLGARVPGARFLDLYAGSGAVGIEAISRGAAEVIFAEKHAPALAAIRANLRTLSIRAGFQVDAGGTATLLKRLGVEALAKSDFAPFDLVFLDPPYDDADEYRRTLTTLGEAVFLHPGALVIAEHTRKQPLLDRYGNLARTRTLLQGDASLSFYAPSEQADPVPDLVP